MIVVKFFFSSEKGDQQPYRVPDRDWDDKRELGRVQPREGDGRVQYKTESDPGARGGGDILCAVNERPVWVIVGEPNCPRGANYQSG